jgi:hypothetical protein
MCCYMHFVFPFAVSARSGRSLAGEPVAGGRTDSSCRTGQFWHETDSRRFDLITPKLFDLL